MKVTVVEDILDANRRVARHNKERFDRARLPVLNLISSPGAGKTALLERTITALRGELRIGVIEGDIQTTLDAERVERAGAAFAHQINTRGACHIDGNMVAPIIEQMDLEGLDLLFIENVGNLVCPASYDLGEDLRVVLMSVTEGEDKPLKYPTIFNTADIAVVTKIDLADAVGVKVEDVVRNIHEVRPGLEILELSARSGLGMNGWRDRLLQLAANAPART